MSLATQLLARFWHLPRATNKIACERDLPVPMPDGVTLLADHHTPLGIGPRPTVLIRSPYGRRGAFGLTARLLAERGYHVVIQSCRGTFGSGGRFYSVRNEAADGHATIAWLATQDWFDGRLGTVGGSYLGYTQWSVAADPPVPIRAMAIQVSSANNRERVQRGGSFNLADTLGWLNLIEHQEGSRFAALTNSVTGPRRLRPLWNHLPLAELDRLAFGRTVPMWQDYLAHPDPDEYWEAIDFRRGLDASTGEFYLSGGWNDIFLPDTVNDYLALRRLGRHPRLLIGSWTHVQSVNGVVLRETLGFLERQLAGGDDADSRPPVRLQQGGTGNWLEFEDWPPPAVEMQWRLQPQGRLAQSEPPTSEPDRYRYDPADPTPSLGGALLNAFFAGPKDNRKLESRPDVLVYSSEPLGDNLDAAGPLAAELFVRSSLDHTDFFARLCDVDERGRSINVSDGLIRLGPGQGPGEVRRVRIEMWPLCYRFRRGHSLRLQVSSGAHPRFARNLGSGEPLGTGTMLRVAEQEVFHDPERASAVFLPASRPIE